MAAGTLDVSVDLRRRVRARREAVPAAPRSLDLQRRAGAERRAVLQAAGVRAARTARAREPQLDDQRRAARAAVRATSGTRSPRSCRATPSSSDVARFGDEEHDARLVIGDAALHLWSRLRSPESVAGDHALGQYRFAYDLGAEWKAWTGLPFVFAVWVAQRTAPVDRALAIHAGLIASRDWGLQHLDTLAAQAALATGVLKPRVRRVSVGARLRTLVSAPGRTHRVLPASRRGGEGARRVARVSSGGVRHTTCAT